MNGNKTQAFMTNQGPLLVRRCGCGAIQIGLGAVSIKLAPAAARYLCSALEENLEESGGGELRLVPAAFHPQDKCCN